MRDRTSRRRRYDRRQPEWQSNPLNLISFVGIISITLGALILLYYFYETDRWDGVEVTLATVSGVQADGETREIALSYNVPDEDGNPQGYTNLVTTNDDRYRNVLVGQNVEIEYVPDDPSVSRLRGVSELPPITLPGSITLCLGGLLMLAVPMGLAISRRV